MLSTLHYRGCNHPWRRSGDDEQEGKSEFSLIRCMNIPFSIMTYTCNGSLWASSTVVTSIGHRMFRSVNLHHSWWRPTDWNVLYPIEVNTALEAHKLPLHLDHAVMNLYSMTYTYVIPLTCRRLVLIRRWQLQRRAWDLHRSYHSHRSKNLEKPQATLGSLHGRSVTQSILWGEMEFKVPARLPEKCTIRRITIKEQTTQIILQRSPQKHS